MRVRWANLQPPPVKFLEDAVYQKVSKSPNFRLSYSQNKKVDVFLRHSVHAKSGLPATKLIKAQFQTATLLSITLQFGTVPKLILCLFPGS